MLLFFQAVTAAAALNDVGSWALIGFQATFYSRVYEVGPEVYAPALAAILPVGGLLGGVGGGLAGDWLSKNGGRAWLTGGVFYQSLPAAHSEDVRHILRHCSICIYLGILQSVSYVSLQLVLSVRPMAVLTAS